MKPAALPPKFAKPDSCKDCPLFGDGQGFVPDEVPEGAAVVFIAQNPGGTEEVQGRPLVGVSGLLFRKQLLARYLPDTKIGFANVLKCRACDAAGRHIDKLPPPGSKVWREAVAHCRPFLVESLGRAPGALLCPMGDHAIKAMTGLGGKVLHLRGSLLKGQDDAA